TDSQFGLVRNLDSSGCNIEKYNNYCSIKTTSYSLNCEDCSGCILNIINKPTLHKRVCESPFICHNCKKPFEQLQNLRKHVLSHVKPRKCKICNKQFRDLNVLTIHLRKHSKTSPFKCHICDKSFRQNYNLKQHIDKHLGLSNVTCRYCNKTFSTKYNANIHMKNVHNHNEKSNIVDDTMYLKMDSNDNYYGSVDSSTEKDIKVEIFETDVKQEGTTSEEFYVKTEMLDS
ncbi:unnamed protein product, partial [Phyllotreta striolata]